jgi:hypothetical protein
MASLWTCKINIGRLKLILLLHARWPMAGNMSDKILAATMGKELPLTYSNGKYLFGIWRDDITRNLLWHVESGKGDLSNELNPRESRRQAGRCASTWSWASVTGRISYIDEVNEEDRSETRLEYKLRSPQLYHHP